METISEFFNKLNHHFVENTVLGGAYFYYVFTFGNLVIVAIGGVLISVTKKIKLLYDFFGVITSGSLVAMFANMVLLLPFYLFLHVRSKSMFYIGFAITAICYLIVLKYLDKLIVLGKALSNKEKEIEI